MIELTASEAAVLDWLSKEDSSALGECKGAALDRLIELGLARLTGHNRGDWSRVELTDLGHSHHRRLGAETAARAAEGRPATQVAGIPASQLSGPEMQRAEALADDILRIVGETPNYLNGRDRIVEAIVRVLAD